jgi:hypothetical protein
LELEVYNRTRRRKEGIVMENGMAIDRAKVILDKFLEKFGKNYKEPCGGCHWNPPRDFEVSCGSFRNCLISKEDCFVIKWDLETTNHYCNSCKCEYDNFLYICNVGYKNLLPIFYGTIKRNQTIFYVWEKLKPVYKMFSLGKDYSNLIKKICELSYLFENSFNISDITASNTGIDESGNIKVYDFAYIYSNDWEVTSDFTSTPVSNEYEEEDYGE